MHHVKPNAMLGNVDKYSFKFAKGHLQKIIQKKKKSKELAKNRNKPKEFWKGLKSQRKMTQFKFKALEKANFYERFYSELAGALQN